MKNQVIIIAEAGVNHNGDIQKAKRLIDAAFIAGVDYVKFQTFKASTLVSPKAKKADYQTKNTVEQDNSQYNMLKKLELSDVNHQELIEYCETIGIKFFSTAFDVEGVEYLGNLNFEMFKIPSGEITNYPYLRAIALQQKPVILSTGMATLVEVEEAVNTLIKFGLKRKDLTILHCNTEYPTPMEDVNLKAMANLGKTFGVNFGYSDHTLGIEVPIAAVALGATIIEKHFTLNRTLPGPDHKASLEPTELKQMVNSIRNIEMAISGNGLKEPSQSELKNKNIARKSIHFKKSIEAGTIITEDFLTALRPGNGISPMKWNEVLGRKTKENMSKFDILNWNDLL